MMKNEKRSPLKDKPLRYPGQSLDEKRDDIKYDHLLTPLLMAMYMVILALLEWGRYLFPVPPAPYLYTFIALIGVGYAAFRVHRVLPELYKLKQGSEGEKAVGQFLEPLRAQGYTVFHDVIGTGFNIDHVLIGPAGVFTIETKTFSKSPGPDITVKFDGERILVDGFELDRDPVVQAKAQAGWLRELLAESTGRRLPVRPVILFPGWWVEQGKDTFREIWVLNHKALPSFLGNEPEVLLPEEIKLASYHLSRFILAKEVA